MKPVIFSLVFSLLALVFASCEKSKTEKIYSNSVLGTWELYGRQAGMVPYETFASGNGNLLKFSTTTFQTFINGQLYKTGTYRVVPDSTAEANVGLVIKEGEYANRIIYEGDDTTRKVFMHISKDTLKLLSGYFPLDGGTYQEYVRRQGPEETEN